MRHFANQVNHCGFHFNDCKVVEWHTLLGLVLVLGYWSSCCNQTNVQNVQEIIFYFIFSLTIMFI